MVARNGFSQVIDSPYGRLAFIEEEEPAFILNSGFHRRQSGGNSLSRRPARLILSEGLANDTCLWGLAWLERESLQPSSTERRGAIATHQKATSCRPASLFPLDRGLNHLLNTNPIEPGKHNTFRSSPRRQAPSWRGRKTN
jgi:hypothetical protein